MTLKNSTFASTVTILTGGADDAIALAVAARMALAAGGEARCLLTLPLSPYRDWLLSAEGAVYFDPKAIEAVDRANAAIRSETEALIRETTEQEGLELDDNGGRIRLLAEQSMEFLGLNADGCLTDLVVATQAAVKSQGLWSGVVAEVLMRARLPLLITRELGSNGVAAVAWDGSDAAGRAVRAALPLLAAASRVVILQDPDHIESARREAADPARLMTYLALHGLDKVDVLSQRGSARDDGLASLASSVDAELVVAGAFSHSRFREEILGGCSDRLIADDKGFNLFLMH
jgi:nucleotide-binding universal stress UspA family protein